MEDAAGGGDGRRTSAGVNWMPERGKLYRFWGSGVPGLGGVAVIRPWPAPAAWAKDDGDKSFHHSIPRIDLRPTHPDPARRQAARWPYRFENEAWERVPESVRAAVCRAHLDGQQWRALSFQARVPGAGRLATDVPLLAAMLSCANSIRLLPVARPLRSARGLLRHPPGWKTWRRIAGWLHLDDSKAMVRMLRSAGAADDALGPWSTTAASMLPTVWRHDHLRKLLMHLPHPTPATGELLGTCVQRGAPDLPTLPLIREVVEQEGRLTLANLIYHLTGLARRLDDPRLLRPARSVAAIEQRLVEAEEALERSGTPSLDTLPFPPPPLPPPPHGRPLHSDAALRREGTEMKHCIGGKAYAYQARGRRGYGYSIRRPDGERATLWIERVLMVPGAFSLQQVQGPRNGAPSAAVHALVKDWLQRHHAWALYRARRGPRPQGPVQPPPPAEWLAPVVSPFPEDDIPF